MSSSAPPDPSARRALALLTGINLLNYTDRYVLPAVIERVRVDIPMNDTRQGLALTMFIFVYMLAAPVFGRLEHRFSRRSLISAGVLLWSVATAATALVRSFEALLLVRALVGVGEAAYATLAPAVLGDLYPPERRGRALVIFNLTTPVGAALGYLLGGQLEQHFSWRMAFLATGAPGVLLAFAALRLPEPERGRYDAVRSEPRPMLETLRELWANKLYVRAVAGYTAFTFALGGLSQWMPSYLQRVRHLSPVSANNLFGALTVLTGLGATAAGGWWAERLRGRARHPDLRACWVPTLAAAPLAALGFLLVEPRHFWLAVAGAEMAAFASTGPINTTIANAVGPAQRATAFAVAILFIHLLGDAFSPTLIGWVSDRTSLGFAVLLVPVFFLLGAALWRSAEQAAPDPTEKAATPAG